MIPPAERWRVVLADDEPEMRAWLCMVLGARTEIREASSGWQLLHLLAEEGPFDLVITDLRMPPPNGLNVVTMARTAGLTTPFLVITAFPDPALRSAIAGIPDTALLAKPFAGKALIAAATRLIARSSPATVGTDGSGW